MSGEESAAFGQRMDGGYEAPILAEPIGGPIPGQAAARSADAAPPSADGGVSAVRPYEPLLPEPLADTSDPWFGGYDLGGLRDPGRYGEAPPPQPDVPPERPYVPLLRLPSGLDPVGDDLLRYNHVHGKGGKFGSHAPAASGGAAATGIAAAAAGATSPAPAVRVRPELAIASTIAHVNTAIEAEAKRITGRQTDVDMTGSDLQIAREHGEAILRGLERFPTAHLRAVNTYDGKKVFGGVHDDAYAVTYNGITKDIGARITFNRSYVGDGDRYRRSLAHAQTVGHLKVGTPHGTASHEFGHVVAMQGRAGAGAKRAASSAAAVAGTKVSAYVRQHISHYATTNEHELAAEAFADVMTNGAGASALSRVVFNAIAEKS